MWNLRNAHVALSILGVEATLTLTDQRHSAVGDRVEIGSIMLFCRSMVNMIYERRPLESTKEVREEGGTI